MAYQLEPHEAIADGVRRIARELIDNALARIDSSGDAPHETVHEVRKDCKKLRGLLRLIRPSIPDLYRRENAAFRDAAATLSSIRDVEAAIETFDDLIERFDDNIDRESLTPLRRQLERHKRDLAEESGDLQERLGACRAALAAARERAAQWELPDAEGGEAGWEIIGAGLQKTYKRGRKAMAGAYGDESVEAFHEWRKRAKYLRYHLRLVRPAWPRLLKRMRSEVKTLGDLLGDDHDMAVLEKVVRQAMGTEDQQERVQLLLALARQRSAQLRAEAHWLGARVYAEKPKRLDKRLKKYWITAQRERVAGGPQAGLRRWSDQRRQ